ncbi:MAG: GIY-YIG nuclease family protein [Candidatus Margulisiibacteriota bacterium]
MYYVYILQSLKDNNLYIGMTANLEGRIKKHNAGGVQSTKSRAPLKLLYHEMFPTRDEARKREKFFKTGIGRETIVLLLNK